MTNNSLNDNIDLFYSTENGDFNYLYSDHLQYSKSLFARIEPILQQYNIKSIIDCCCGVGNDLLYFAKRGYSISGSDISSEMLKATKENMDKHNFSVNLFQSNVVNVSKNIQEKFDLVIFRGNALGHLNKTEQIEAIKGLFDITKNGGLLLIDFRNGEAYFKKKRCIEQRGIGINKDDSEIYFCFYHTKHPKTSSERYKITSRIYIFNYKRLKIRKIKSRIDANYVLKENIVDTINSEKREVIFYEKGIEGLQELETFIIKKE
ncbi:MAG: class I SAM-dependent methyltransferase [Suipraeoptans sp.]